MNAKYSAMFAIRFVVFGCIMAFINLLPYLLTRGAWTTDGTEIAGWPLRCYAFGGIGGYVSFNPWAMAGNILIAVVVSAFLAWFFRDGTGNTFRKVKRTFRKAATWGTPYA